MFNRQKKTAAITTVAIVVMAVTIGSAAVTAQVPSQEGQQHMEPNPEINGNVSIWAFTIENPKQLKLSDLILAPDYTAILFDKKNLTNGYELMQDTNGFFPSDAYITWTGHIKIPINETETLVKPIHAFFNVFKIIDYPETDSKEFDGEGILTIGDARWEPVGGSYTVLNNSSGVIGILAIWSSEWLFLQADPKTNTPADFNG